MSEPPLVSLPVSLHARERMRRRDVTVAELDAILLHPARDAPAEPPDGGASFAPDGRRVSRVLAGRRVVAVVGPSAAGGASVWTVWRCASGGAGGANRPSADEERGAGGGKRPPADASQEPSRPAGRRGGSPVRRRPRGTGDRR